MLQVHLEVPAEHYEAYIAQPLRDLYAVGVSTTLLPHLAAWRRGVVDRALQVRHCRSPAFIIDLHCGRSIDNQLH